MSAWLTGMLLTTMLGCQSTPKNGMEDDVTARWYYGQPLYEAYVRSFTPEGTFAAFNENLDRIKLLGVDNIWLMPIHPLGELGRKGSLGSPYSVHDYFETNPEFGSKEEFQALVDSVHAKDMHIILDMVMNHSANDHKEMGAHPEWYMRDEKGNFFREVEDWSDITDWDFDNPETVDYLTGVLEYWVREFDVDGYRCDVAGMVPREFWEHVIPRLKAIKPDVYMLAEWEEPWILDAGFNSAYDWTLYHRMKDHAAGKIDVDSLWTVIEATEAAYGEHKLPLRFVENHDEQRSAKVFGYPDVMPYANLIFTLPGIPLIYNGQEAGAKTKPSLFEREPIKWETTASGGYMHLYHNLIKMRKENVSLLTGDLVRVHCNTEGAMVFLRRAKQQQALVAINFTGDEVTATFPVKDLQGLFVSGLEEMGAIEGETAALTIKPYQGRYLFSRPKTSNAE
ncbi:alpha-amylase [bacterium]|nr:alpha-amylase [bacterium]